MAARRAKGRGLNAAGPRGYSADRTRLGAWTGGSLGLARTTRGRLACTYACSNSPSGTTQCATATCSPTRSPRQRHPCRLGQGDTRPAWTAHQRRGLGEDPDLGKSGQLNTPDQVLIAGQIISTGVTRRRVAGEPNRTWISGPGAPIRPPAGAPAASAGRPRRADLRCDPVGPAGGRRGAAAGRHQIATHRATCPALA